MVESSASVASVLVIIDHILNRSLHTASDESDHGGGPCCHAPVEAEPIPADTTHADILPP